MLLLQHRPSYWDFIETTSKHIRPAPNVFDSIGSVRQRIAIFETLSTDNQLMSTRKSDTPPELTEVSKYKKYSPLRERPSEAHKPKTLPGKSESDQSDGCNETQKGTYEVQKYNYESDRIAAQESGRHSGIYELQKHMPSECSGTPETVGNWKKTENKHILKAVIPLEIDLQQTVTQEIFTQKGDQEAYFEIRTVEGWEIIDEDEIHAVNKEYLAKQLEVTGKETKSKGSVCATQKIPARRITIDPESTICKILVPA
ncbi:unnamed protein product [Cercopithifilaria johnstoni]|uniref:Uncharacterized protein n=1 Tax=Cercopithifilaria johnstoni TaxID=2874296 RepID=A0A8J2LSI4_9BILA|nr:unnamed protein product [Cercopithifilaria johnstoni]